MGTPYRATLYRRKSGDEADQHRLRWVGAERLLREHSYAPLRTVLAPFRCTRLSTLVNYRPA